MIERLSERVFFVKGDDAAGPNPKIGILFGGQSVLLVDVSNRKEMLDEALAFARSERPGCSLASAITHFHDDHVANLRYLPSGTKIYCRKATARHLEVPCEIINSETDFDLGGFVIKLLPVPSLHAEGCLDVLADGFLFVGDSLYPRQKGSALYYNREIAAEMLKSYAGISFVSAVPAHEGPLRTKSEVLAFLAKLKTDGWGDISI
jgi:glyoxylase-like metal-dependent hydrolase (beta-lactamase superfamily II)